MESTLPSAEIRVWSPNAIGLFCLFFAFPAGAPLAARDWRLIGRRDRQLPHAISVSIAVLTLVLAVLVLPRQVGGPLVLGLNVGSFIAYRKILSRDIEGFRVARPEIAVFRRPWYTGLGWAIGGILAMYLVLSGVVLGMRAVGFQVK